jgi:hypothetical protein
VVLRGEPQQILTPKQKIENVYTKLAVEALIRKNLEWSGNLILILVPGSKKLKVSTLITFFILSKDVIFTPCIVLK